MSGDSHQELKDTVADLLALVQRLEQVHGHAENRDESLSRMTEALETTTHDLWERADKPLMLDLLMFFDSLQWFQTSLLDQDVSRDIVAESYQHLLDEFLEMLGRRDILPMDSKRSLDETLHRVVRAVPTTIEQDDGRVLQVLRRGFLRDGQVLRKEEVLVLTHDRDQNGLQPVDPPQHPPEKLEG